VITSEILKNAYSYRQYRELIDTLAPENKTTGLDQSDEMVGYAKLNIQRMQRLEKSVVLNDGLCAALKQIQRPLFFVVLTEGWCGDAAQNVPVFSFIEKAADKIELKLLLRDENPELMNQYLTNGAKAIPKLICIEQESLKEVFVWGPRPKACQELVIDLKAKGATLKEKGEAVHLWYARDKTQTLQLEMTELLMSIN
jgi:hypothetical protein